MYAETLLKIKHSGAFTFLTFPSLYLSRYKGTKDAPLKLWQLTKKGWHRNTVPTGIKEYVVD
tara:strand:- start:202 stop:387 length:186 start_codon:yes stop_codon:yes gene_type:complete